MVGQSTYWPIVADPAAVAAPDFLFEFLNLRERAADVLAGDAVMVTISPFVAPYHISTASRQELAALQVLAP